MTDGRSRRIYLGEMQTLSFRYSSTRLLPNCFTRAACATDAPPGVNRQGPDPQRVNKIRDQVTAGLSTTKWRRAVQKCADNTQRRRRAFDPYDFKGYSNTRSRGETMTTPNGRIPPTRFGSLQRCVRSSGGTREIPCFGQSRRAPGRLGYAETTPHPVSRRPQSRAPAGHPLPTDRPDDPLPSRHTKCTYLSRLNSPCKAHRHSQRRQ